MCYKFGHIAIDCPHFFRTKKGNLKDKDYRMSKKTVVEDFHFLEYETTLKS